MDLLKSRSSGTVEKAGKTLCSIAENADNQARFAGTVAHLTALEVSEHVGLAGQQGVESHLLGIRSP